MKKPMYAVITGMLFLIVLSCTDHLQPMPEPQAFSSEAFVSGLKSPIGIAADDKGNLWVSEAGTGNNNNDGSIALITPSGTKTIFVSGLKSVTGEGTPEGISHLHFRNGKLYFLHGVSGMLYIADVSMFKTGDAAVKLSDIPSEDIGTFVRSLALTDPLNSNAFNLTFGPDDHLYIVDSGANAIIKRDKVTGKLSLFTHFPNTSENAEAVPTGIVYDGSKFLVSTLTGFPFSLGKAKIYQVDNAGTVRDYKADFTTLTGITLSVNKKPIVIQYSVFGARGFAAKTGKILDENGNTLLDHISNPTDIIRTGDKMYYLLSYNDGTITKVSY